MKKPFLLFVTAAALAVACIAVPARNGAAAAAATPPPSPPPLSAATPGPLPSSVPMPAKSVETPDPSASSEPDIFSTPSPPPNARQGINGVWEVQIQRGTQVQYTHFKIKQTDNALTGVYLDQSNKQFPLAGSLDGKDVRIIVTLKDGSSLTFAATLDGTTDMLGLLTTPKDSVPFTAAYRPKEDFLENINAGPAMGGQGGLSGQGGITPP